MRLRRVSVSSAGQQIGIAVVLTAVLVPTATAAPVPPAADPFYRPPPNLSAYRAGSIIRSRPVDVALGPLSLSREASAYQLLYRTNDARGRAVANATTVLVPQGATPAGGRQLLSVNDAEDSVDSGCAPSYQLQTGEPDNHNLAAELQLAEPQLQLGRDLVIPDAEGPRSEYIVTGMEGHATLDSIRAVEHFAPAKVNGVRTSVGLIGYSGGAHVTAAAAELAPGYAPEVNIVGQAAGGVPVGNRETVDYLDGSVGAGVLMATSIALNRAFPELRLDSFLNDKGKAFARQVSTGCATSVFAAPYAHFSDWTTVPHPFDIPAVARIIAANALGHGTPTAPTFFYNGEHDELITITALDELVARYCASGARIDYYRDPAGAEHIQGVANFFGLALSYLTQRFNGDPVPSTCPPAQPRPSNAFVVRRWRQRGDQTVVVAVRIPGPGTVAAAQRRRPRMVRSARATASRAGTLRLVLRLTPAARGRLRHQRRLAVAVAVSFTPFRGVTATRTIRIRLRALPASCRCSRPATAR